MFALASAFSRSVPSSSIPGGTPAGVRRERRRGEAEERNLREIPGRGAPRVRPSCPTAPPRGCLSCPLQARVGRTFGRSGNRTASHPPLRVARRNGSVSRFQISPAKVGVEKERLRRVRPHV
jgi:hypothetical protein